MESSWGWPTVVLWVLASAAGSALPVRAESDTAAARPSSTTQTASRPCAALDRLDDAVASGRLRVERAGTAAERASANLALGRALFDRALAEAYPSVYFGPRACDPDPETGAESMRQAAETFRLAAEGTGVERRDALLSLADCLLRFGLEGETSARHDAFAEAARALEQYAAEGGRSSLADDLRCWTDFVLGGREGKSGAADGWLRSSSDHGVRAPIKTSGRAAHYTARARKKRVMGAVFMVALIDEEGRVVCVRPLTNLAGGLDTAATRAIRTFLFKPATVSGEPVAVSWTVTSNFTLQ